MKTTGVWGTEPGGGRSWGPGTGPSVTEVTCIQSAVGLLGALGRGGWPPLAGLSPGLLIRPSSVVCVLGRLGPGPSKGGRGDVIQNRIAPVLEELPGWEDRFRLWWTWNFFRHLLGTVIKERGIVICTDTMRPAVGLISAAGSAGLVSITHFPSRPRGCATYWTLPIIAGSTAWSRDSPGL